MLAECSSRQLAEWRAFERVDGFLGDDWNQEVAAGIHEQLQLIAYLMGAQMAGRRKKNPVNKPSRFPRAAEMLKELRDKCLP